MRLDLHNHTMILAKHEKGKALQAVERYRDREIFWDIIKAHPLDGIAITNFHNVDVALSLAKEYPKHVVVGAEYRVSEEEGVGVHVVVLGLDTQLHALLMQARLRGIAYFTSVLREKNLVFYLSHLGWLWPDNQSEWFHNLLSFFDAIEVLDTTLSPKNSFATGVAKYYNLAPIGGSGSLALEGRRRAYTEVPEAQTHEDFFLGLHQKKAKVGTTSSEAHAGSAPSVWQMSKNFYQEEMKKLWHSEVGLGREATLGILMQNLAGEMLVPILQAIPKAFHLHHKKASERNLSSFPREFIDYLKLKETKRIFTLAHSLEEKKNLWAQAMAKIHECFIL